MTQPIMLGTGYKTLAIVKDGAVGPAGPEGKPAEFPNTLPDIPTLKGRVSGISTLILNWTSENKIYYKYELYGSRMPNFNISQENLLYEGVAGTYIMQVAPGEVWYFRVRVRNSYNKTTESSNRVELKTKKVDDFSIIAENGAIKNALIDNLNADKIKAGTISTDILKTNVITAINATIGTATINGAKIGELDASKITTGKISSNIIQAGSIDATKINTSAINAIEVGAAKIVAGDITSGTIKVGNANIVDGTISMAKIDKVEITDANIKKGTILNAFIDKLDARKITTGSLDASKVQISSASGNLTISDNTIQIKDAQAAPRVRVQVGKDSRGKYGLLVFNEGGEAIFDSDKGILTSNGLSKDVVSSDKIRDEAIGPTKLNIESLFVGDNAFITKLSSLEIDAERIKTGKISGERIDIDGLVSFKSFNPDMQKVFDVKGDKTYINGGMIAANTITADKINANGLTISNKNKEVTFAIKDDGNIEVNGLLRSGNYSAENNTGYQISTDGKAILNQAEIRGDVILPNAGITNSGINENPIRFWAGSNYANRESAPFRVMQNGDVYAKNVELLGQMFGSLNNENLTIDNGELVINEAITTLNDSGEILTKAPRGENKLYVQINQENCIFNTNVSLSNHIRFTKDNSEKGSALNIDSTNIAIDGEMVDLVFNPSVGALGGLNIFTNNGGQHILRGSTDKKNIGTLVFDNEGSQGESADYLFTKKDGKDSCKVEINGEVTVEKLSSSQQKIVIKSIPGEGWGFYLS